MERTAHPRTAANIAGSGREHLPSRRFLEIGLEEAARTLDFGQPVGITILGLLLFTSTARSPASREFRGRSRPGTMATVKRVVILGRGGAGKSALAARLCAITGIPVIELDTHFWRPDLEATPPDHWAAVQRELVRGETWIMDGDLGPYDVLDVRLRAADTVVLLDFSFWRCAWRAIRRSRERADFWQWVWSYRRHSRPLLLAATATHAPAANLHVIRNPHALRRFVAQVTSARPA